MNRLEGLQCNLCPVLWSLCGTPLSLLIEGLLILNDFDHFFFKLNKVRWNRVVWGYYSVQRHTSCCRQTDPSLTWEFRAVNTAVSVPEKSLVADANCGVLSWVVVTSSVVTTLHPSFLITKHVWNNLSSLFRKSLQWVARRLQFFEITDFGQSKN